MRRILIAAIVCTSFAFTGCIKEDYFGKSSNAQITGFQIPGQVGTTVIDQEALTVVVPMPENTTDFNLAPSVIEVSNFATTSPGVNEVQDFSGPVAYTVTAEDGNIRVYMVSVEGSNANVQLPNSSFEDWYTETVGLAQVEQPGVDAATTIWGTANRGLAMGGTDGNTTPEQKGADSLYVRLESVAAPALVRIAAATIFTGSFTTGFPSISDPRSNIDLGVPFAGRPTQVAFSYTYQPGASNEDENGVPLTYGDMCDVYVLLENRDGATTKRVGTAWFRSGNNVAAWQRKTVEVKYGPLAQNHPWFDYAQPQPDQEWGNGTEPITHISVLATSSFEGDFFKGAIGSVLELDNFELVY